MAKGLSFGEKADPISAPQSGLCFGGKREDLLADEKAHDAKRIARILSWDNYSWERKLGSNQFRLLKEKSFGGRQWDENWTWRKACRRREILGGPEDLPLSRLASIWTEAREKLLMPPVEELSDGDSPEPGISEEKQEKDSVEGSDEKERKEKTIEQRYPKCLVLRERNEQNKLARLALRVYNSAYPDTKWSLVRSTGGHGLECTTGVFYHMNFLATNDEHSPPIVFFAEFEHPSLSKDAYTKLRINLLGEILPVKCTAVISERESPMVKNAWCYDGNHNLHPEAGEYHGAGSRGDFCMPLGLHAV